MCDAVMSLQATLRRRNCLRYPAERLNAYDIDIKLLIKVIKKTFDGLFVENIRIILMKRV